MDKVRRTVVAMLGVAAIAAQGWRSPPHPRAPLVPYLR